MIVGLLLDIVHILIIMGEINGNLAAKVFVLAKKIIPPLFC